MSWIPTAVTVKTPALKAPVFALHNISSLHKIVDLSDNISLHSISFISPLSSAITLLLKTSNFMSISKMYKAALILLNYQTIKIINVRQEGKHTDDHNYFLGSSV